MRQDILVLRRTAVDHEEEACLPLWQVIAFSVTVLYGLILVVRLMGLWSDGDIVPNLFLDWPRYILAELWK